MRRTQEMLPLDQHIRNMTDGERKPERRKPARSFQHLDIRAVVMLSVANDDEVSKQATKLLQNILWEYRPGETFAMKTAREIAKQSRIAPRQFQKCIILLSERQHIEISGDRKYLISPMVECTLPPRKRAKLEKEENQYSFPWHTEMPETALKYIRTRREHLYKGK